MKSSTKFMELPPRSSFSPKLEFVEVYEKRKTQMKNKAVGRLDRTFSMERKKNPGPSLNFKVMVTLHMKN